ncbi:MAG: DUF1800 domain-containing protein [Rhodospirillaceae bacterium]|nr:DUF1800 domain-containing protein [Rhodospirillaceae bacterium]
MASLTPSQMHAAINRVSFGARDLDVTRAQQMGWDAWIDDQLAPPAGDDAGTAQILSNSTYRIVYGARDDMNGTWPAVDEERPLNSLTMTGQELFETYDEVFRLRTLPQTEIGRLVEETIAATWIRNVHSTYQVREFLTDFWHRHFNVASSEGAQVQFALPTYDRDVMRKHALGNFRELVEANAKSTSMLFYLDNADSRAFIPNENYARELLELHTMGRGSYLGVVATPTAQGTSNLTATAVPMNGLGTGTQSAGFTDTDILHASRALSGWTVAMGQRIGTRTLPRTGEFVFEPTYHNRNAGAFMGIDLRPLQPTQEANFPLAVEQGRKVIELAAEHTRTGGFVVGKLAHRMFGDSPPQELVYRAYQAWMDNRKSSNQIAEVMRVFLTSDEIANAPPTKLRRPYEKVMAFARAVNARIRPHRAMFTTFGGTRDMVFQWPSPDGWPDDNVYWLSTSATMTQWNALLTAMASGPLSASITAESVQTKSITVLLDDWIQRIVGRPISTAGYNALVSMATASTGIRAYVGMGTASTTTIETELRRLVALIATAPEFAYR